MRTAAMRPRPEAVLLLGALLLGAAGDPPPRPPQGAPGVTSLSGQVLDTGGAPLPNVRLLVGAAHARSDAAGQFLIPYVTSGKTVLQIDGTHAGVTRKEDHGFYEVRVTTRPGRTTVLPFKSYLPLIDHAHEVAIPRVTRAPVVVGAPSLPGLELHVPAGVAVRDVDGKPARALSLTLMPKDRTPFPLPTEFDLPVFFTIQPGAACLYDARGGVGAAQLFYPNVRHELPRARATFWRYEPDGEGWRAHGTGSVTADGSQVAPDADTVITDLGSAECDPKTHTRQKPPRRPDRRLMWRLSH